MIKYFSFLLCCLFGFMMIAGCSSESAVKLKRAQEHFDNSEYISVIRILETINPVKRGSRVNLLLGKAYAVQFEFEKADHVLKSAFEQFPSTKDSLIAAYLTMAKRFEKRKRVDLAIKAYLSLLGIESEYNIGNGFYVLGHHYYESNDLARAMQFFEKGIETISDPRILRKTKIELIDIYELVGKLKEAIEISANDPSTDIIFRRGKLSFQYAKSLFSAKEFDSALAYCESVIIINAPQTIIDDTYFLMGEIHASNNDYKNAIRCYKEVMKFDKFENNKLAAIAKKKIAVLTRFE
ncbi:MAG: tetratricopeptide repeat protein [Candidatus Cloacimonadota bacterium]|nr:MAG: tetratricopeptide repeat protein [Candidatus Cloacimonadota bacterium]